jgi:hypothetical protein
MRGLRVLAVAAAIGMTAGCAYDRIGPAGTVTGSGMEDRRIEQINSPGPAPASPTQTPGR